MNHLANAFSLLGLDVADDREETDTAVAGSGIESSNGRGKKKKGRKQVETPLPKNADGDQHKLEAVSDDYGMPLVWIDLEMTEYNNGKGSKAGQNKIDPNASIMDFGKEQTTAHKDDIHCNTLAVRSESFHDEYEKNNIIECFIIKEYNGPINRRPILGHIRDTGLDVEVDRILEIACIITDGKLSKSIEGPDLVISQSKECMDKMGEWCQTHHAASGLTEKVLQSRMSEQEAEKQVAEFVKKHVGTYTPHLAGNSIYTDYLFMKKYMPDLASLFSHVLVDVSSVKALCCRWYPKGFVFLENKKAPSKRNNHRAMDDIKESIAELKYYKENIFKPKSRK